MTPETMTVPNAAGNMFAALERLTTGLFLWLRANMQRMCGELREEVGGGRDEIEGRPPNARPEGGRPWRARGPIRKACGGVDGKTEFPVEFVIRWNDLPSAPAE